MYKNGDIVRIRPEWRDHPEKPGFLYVVIDVNEVTNRCIIQALGTGMSLPPQEVVTFEMIEKQEETA